ncbi:hypothetical protein TNCV_1907341 [Trichonephila clavipes]|nr:hypothetical protein TNCV_1907341 [Trichonephila clavipes]
MDVCTCIVSSQYGIFWIAISIRKFSHEVGGRGREARDPCLPPGYSPLKLGRNRATNRTVTCMKLKANNMLKNLVLSRDEFRGYWSYVLLSIMWHKQQQFFSVLY